MTPEEMIQAAIQALDDAETGSLSYGAAAHVAMAWAALAAVALQLRTENGA